MAELKKKEEKGASRYQKDVERLENKLTATEEKLDKLLDQKERTGNDERMRLLEDRIELLQKEKERLDAKLKEKEEKPEPKIEAKTTGQKVWSFFFED